MIFLLGGARSGKSILAVSIASGIERPVRFIATAQAEDEEMARRVEEHRKHRPSEWTVVEEPIDVGRAVVDTPDDDTIVLDCVTLWLSNLMTDRDDEEILGMVDEAIMAVNRRSGETIVVSNEVGAGVVPMHSLARRFRDMQGGINQRFAQAARSAYLVVAGRALRLDDAEDVY